LLVHDLVPTSQRNQIIDLTLPWAYDYFAFLIPAPDETANINSVVKPFQWQVCAFQLALNLYYFNSFKLFNLQVWLGLGVSIICVIAVLNLIQRYLEYRSAFHMDFKPRNKKPKTGNLQNNRKVKRYQTGKQYLYVLGILLSQGYLKSKLDCHRHQAIINLYIYQVAFAH
jgi:ionotropic glutamate receptor